MNRLFCNLTLLTVMLSAEPRKALAKNLSAAQPRDQVIVVATAGNTVQRYFPRTVEVLQNGVLVLKTGRMEASKKVDMKGRSDTEIAKAVMEAVVEVPGDRKGNLLLYRQPLDEDGIFIGGAVNSPKFIPVVKGLRLEDAITAAGGRTPQADDQILIIRSDGQKFSRIYSSADWKNTLLFSRDRIIVFYREVEE